MQGHLPLPAEVLDRFVGNRMAFQDICELREQG